MGRQLGGFGFSMVVTALLGMLLARQPFWLNAPLLFLAAGTADIWVRRVGAGGPGPRYMEAYLLEWGQGLFLAMLAVLASIGVRQAWGPPIAPLWPVLAWRLLAAWYPADREGRLPL